MAYNIWERWPWTSFRNLNLDWLMKATEEAVTKAEQVSESVGQFDARITQNTNAIEQLGIDLETISSPAHVLVNSELEARYRGNLVTGAQLVAMMRAHGDLPYVEYNGEVYMLDSASTAGDLRFSMAHTTLLGDVTLRHIMIPAQSSNAAYSITNIDGGSGSSGNVFAVIITDRGAYADPEYIMDSTFDTIRSQMNAGRTPVFLIKTSASGGDGYNACGNVVSTTSYIDVYDPLNSTVIGKWRIYPDNTISRFNAIVQLAALDNIVDMVNDGVSTNALLKTAQTLSAAEQAQVKQNIGISDSGGSYSPYLIPVTQSGGVYSTTATGEDVLDHILDCRIVFNGVNYYPIGATTSGPSGHAYFASIDPSKSGQYDIEIFDIELNGTSACTVTRYEKDVIYNGAQPYLPINASAATIPPLPVNTLVEFVGEAAALNITLAQPANNSISNEYHFIFTSGATPTTLSIPNTVRQPDGFTVEANHVYEVSILNNNMTAQGWAVTA